jgi:hypothetical protein
MGSPRQRPLAATVAVLRCCVASGHATHEPLAPCLEYRVCVAGVKEKAHVFVHMGPLDAVIFVTRVLQSAPSTGGYQGSSPPVQSSSALMLAPSVEHSAMALKNP